MIWTITIICFVASGIAVAALFFAFSVGEGSVGERLGRLWAPGGHSAVAGFRHRQKAHIEKALTNVGKLLPASGKGASRTERLMVRAGYRRPEYIQTLQGVKLLLPLALLALVYFTGFYEYNPVFIVLSAIILGFLIPEVWLTRRVRFRQRKLFQALPDALDLLVVCVEAGLGLDQAMIRVSQEIRLVHPELSEELTRVNLEMRIGQTRADALRDLGTRTGLDEIKTLVAMLIQTDRFGTDLAESLRVHSEKLRTMRRQRAEEMAAKTSVKMIAPLVFFIFPALFVVLLGPAVISLVREFFPVMGP
ncbi:MAG: type II secretion system F family protein [Candidatus Acidiferrales bacterium]